jgi:hypothetical protein
MTRYHSPREYLEEARSFDTSSARLNVLAKTQWEFVRAAVAANPNTSVQTLVGLLPTGMNAIDQPIAVEIARRPDAPPELLRQLATRFGQIVNLAGRSMNSELGLALISNPGTPMDVIEALLDPKRSTAHFRLVLARKTPRGDVLERLKKDVGENVRRVAEKRVAESVKNAR